MNILNRLKSAIANWQTRRTTIAALSALNDQQLRDIGIHRGEIEFVARNLTRGTSDEPIPAVTVVMPLPQQTAPPREWREAA